MRETQLGSCRAPQIRLSDDWTQYSCPGETQFVRHRLATEPAKSMNVRFSYQHPRFILVALASLPICPAFSRLIGAQKSVFFQFSVER